MMINIIVIILIVYVQAEARILEKQHASKDGSWLVRLGAAAKQVHFESPYLVTQYCRKQQKWSRNRFALQIVQLKMAGLLVKHHYDFESPFWVTL